MKPAAAAPAAPPPRIPVIVPSYNSGAFLRQLLDEVPRRHEVLVQDAESIDGSRRQVATGLPNHLNSLGARS